MLTKEVKCGFKGKMNDREADAFCSVVKRLKTPIWIQKGNRRVNGKIKAAILNLNIQEGETITLILDDYFSNEEELTMLAKLLEGGCNREMYSDIIKQLPEPSSQNYI